MARAAGQRQRAQGSTERSGLPGRGGYWRLVPGNQARTFGSDVGPAAVPGGRELRRNVVSGQVLPDQGSLHGDDHRQLAVVPELEWGGARRGMAGGAGPTG